MKEEYKTPEMKIVPILMKDIVTLSGIVNVTEAPENDLTIQDGDDPFA